MNKVQLVMQSNFWCNPYICSLEKVLMDQVSKIILQEEINKFQIIEILNFRIKITPTSQRVFYHFERYKLK